MFEYVRNLVVYAKCICLFVHNKNATSLSFINSTTNRNVSNYIHYKVCDIITYPFINYNGATVEVLECISNFILHFTGNAITYPCWD